MQNSNRRNFREKLAKFKIHSAINDYLRFAFNLRTKKRKLHLVGKKLSRAWDRHRIRKHVGISLLAVMC